MTDLKKKISLYMALIMVFGLFAPFAMPLRVAANPPGHAGLRVMDDGFALIAEQGAGAPAHRAPDGGFPRGAIMLAWDINENGLYVLRFFDDQGRRIELTLQAFDGHMAVNFDAYIGVNAAGFPVTAANPGTVAAYRHVMDGTFPLLSAANAFHIFDTLSGNWFPVGNYFDNTFTIDMMDPILNTDFPYQGRRVNNRVRFATPSAVSGPHPAPGATNPFSLTHPEFPNTQNDDPLFFDRVAATRLTTPEANLHFNRLSPSFNIAQTPYGAGYSFRFLGTYMHFRWGTPADPNTFLFYIDDTPTRPGLSYSIVYAFDLDFYAVDSAQAANYFTYNVPHFRANAPVSHPIPAWIGTTPNPAPTQHNRVYVFPGFAPPTYLGRAPTPSNFVDSVVAIPFAQSIRMTTGPGIDSQPIAIPYGTPGDGIYRHPVDNTDPIFMAREPAPAPGTQFPVFDTLRVRMPQDFYDSTPVSPASQSVGMDIRFNLPNVFNEATGRFEWPIHYYMAQTDNILPNNLQAQVTMTAQGNSRVEDFNVSLNLAALQPFNPDANRPAAATLGGATLNDRIQVRDASLLHRAERAHIPITDPHGADRVRIVVDYLRPSTMYDSVMVHFELPVGATDDGSFVCLGRHRSVVSPANPFYTFLNFSIVNLQGRYHLSIIPFGFYTDGSGIGTYQMWGMGQWHLSDRATAFFEGGAPVVLLPMPSGIDTVPRDFQILFSREEIAPHLPDAAALNRLVRSQVVVWTPTGDPWIGVPSDFRIVKNDILRNPLLRPMPGFDDYHPPTSGAGQPNSVAELTFWAEWEIGSTLDITTLVDAAGADRFTTGGALNITYRLGRALAPDIGPREADALLLDPSYAYFADVTLEIFRGPERLVGEAMYRPLYARITGQYVNVPYRETPTGYPNIYFRGPVIEQTVELSPVTSRITGDPVFLIRVPFLTDVTHRYRVTPPPAHIRPNTVEYGGFGFPSIYFMNVQALAWDFTRYYAQYGTSTTYRFPPPGEYSLRLPISNFDYIVLDDIRRPAGPPPPTLTATALENREAPPQLNVRINVPTAALRTHFNSLYPHQDQAVQITTDLFIGEFGAPADDPANRRSVIENTFFAGETPPPRITHAPGVSLDPRYRSEMTYTIPFSEFYSPTWRGYIDLATYANYAHVLNLLRGIAPEGVTDSIGGGARAHETGVIRISGVPLMWHHTNHSVAAGTRPYQMINFPEGASEAEMLESFHTTHTEINRHTASTYPIDFRVLGLDENRRYYLFADMTMQKFVTPAAVSATPGAITAPHPSPREGDAEFSTSIFTGITSATTMGTVVQPDPGEVGPSAPENLRAPREYTGATYASILWNPIFPSPGEEAYVRYEWEIFRILDRTRLTEEQLRMTETDLATFLAREVDSAEVFAWFTNTRDDNRYITYLPSGEEIFHPGDGEHFEFNFDGEEDIVFRDLTLSPNRLYFYYVRTVRIVLLDDPQLGIVESRAMSDWVEVPVTTSPVTAPEYLRVEDGEILRPGMDLQTQIFVSWQHDGMAGILATYGTEFEFEFRLRDAEGAWQDITTVSAAQMLESNLDPNNSLRIRYMISGLDPGTVYQMQVRLRDIVNDDTSLWSNTITFVTEFPQEEVDLERDVDDWLNFLRRHLEDLIRQPFWFAQNTPTSAVMVYRPGDIFRGHMQGTPGTAIPLFNTDTNFMVIYLPATVIADAREDRRGFSTSFSDLDILFAPNFLNIDHNQVLMDMERLLNARNSVLTDYFVRMEFIREPFDYLFNVPSLAPQTTIEMSLVATNQNIRSIATWDRNISAQAENIINTRMSDPVLRQSIRNLLVEGTEPEYMLGHIDTIVESVARQITLLIAGDMHARSGGILSDTTKAVTEFNAAMHVIVTSADYDTSVNAFRRQANQWVPQTTVEHANGRGVTSRTPATFAFTGRRVVIPDIAEVPRASAVTSIVARFGLEDLFGVNVDLHRNATRQMVVGSVARMAGAPHGADPMTWAAQNLNVQMSSRNATGLISRQEAIAMVMAVYEMRTGTTVASVRIRNTQNTAGMQLDNRYAQAVRAAFEVGIVSDTEMNPAGSITIGEFLNMLAELGSRVSI